MNARRFASSDRINITVNVDKKKNEVKPNGVKNENEDDLEVISKKVRVRKVS